MLQIYNTLSRSKQTFIPIEPGRVKIYVCGMTVYDYCHIGHARVMIVFDMVVRWLRASGYSVTYVRNITDIDDKIIHRAVENGESISELTKRFIDAMHADSDQLDLMRPDLEPCATDFIGQMQDMIGRLIENKLAYQGEDGDVNFAVRLFPSYGRLSGKSLDELNAGERVAIGSGKRDPLDFVLWKKAKAEEPSDSRWQSPWGEGRPGWHIECSAMSCNILGQNFDIHGGGADLQFPHHENEIAQSEGAFYGKSRNPDEKPFVNYWMHNGHIRVNEEKMSKSLGNFFLIRDVLKSFDPEVLRFFILRAHYRSPVNFSDLQLEEARSGLVRLYTSLVQTPELELLGDDLKNVMELAGVNDWINRFKNAMDDDFNTPEALSVLFELASEVNRSQGELRLNLARVMRVLAGMIGILQRNPVNFLQSSVGDSLSTEAIEMQIAARTTAKQVKDFLRADIIRKTLLEQGVVLEDKPGGVTEWRRV